MPYAPNGSNRNRRRRRIYCYSICPDSEEYNEKIGSGEQISELKKCGGDVNWYTFSFI
jgi:hypothetical protein